MNEDDFLPHASELDPAQTILTPNDSGGFDEMTIGDILDLEQAEDDDQYSLD